MSTKDKLIERFKGQPKDFTWDELVSGISSMERLEYKGYFGSIEYSKEDNCLFGKVMGLNKEICITYEGVTADELYHDFQAGIEDYLDLCQRKGIKPKKSYNGILNIRIPAEIHNRIAMYADNNGTSINSFIRDSIERRLEVVGFE
jgi:predicted HicB family RNase H-like nuclease